MHYNTLIWVAHACKPSWNNTALCSRSAWGQTMRHSLTKPNPPQISRIWEVKLSIYFGYWNQTQGRKNNVKKVCYCLNMEPHQYHHRQKACVWNLSSQLVAPFWKTVEEGRSSWGKWATGTLSLEDDRLVLCHFWPPVVVFQLPLSPRTKPSLLWQTAYPEPTQTSPLNCLCQVFSHKDKSKYFRDCKVLCRTWSSLANNPIIQHSISLSFAKCHLSSSSYVLLQKAFEYAILCACDTLLSPFHPVSSSLSR